MATKKTARVKKSAAKKGAGAAAGTARAAKRQDTAMRPKTYVSPPISLAELEQAFTRADLEFEGVDHSEASYEARIFLNKPDANEDTPMTEAEGYAGSYHVFGHGGCFGDVGHCEIRELPRLYDPRPAHPLSPLKKTVIATEAIRTALAKGPEVTVTIVPVITGVTEKCSTEAVLKFESLMIVTYL